MSDDDAPADVPTADLLEDAVWATLTPEEKQGVARTYARGGREAVREVVREQYRLEPHRYEKYSDADALVAAVADALIQSLGDVDADE